MLVEQGRGLLGELRAQCHALLDQAADQVGIGDVGGLDRLAGIEHAANDARPGVEVGLLPARGRELGRELGELLIGEAGIVGADKEIGLGAELLDVVFRFDHLRPQLVDFGGEPLAGAARLLLLVGFLDREIGVDDRIDHARGQFRIRRLEFNQDHARLVDRQDAQAFVEIRQHPLLGRLLQRVLAETEHRQENRRDRHAAQGRIEFRLLVELELLDDGERDVARLQNLRLAGEHFDVDAIANLGRLPLGLGPQENVLAALDQEARFGFVSRGDEVDGEKRQYGGDQSRNDDLPLLAPERRSERAKVELPVRPLYRRNATITTCTHPRLQNTTNTADLRHLWFPAG